MDNTVKLGNGARYSEIMEMKKVLVRVPKPSDSMRRVPGGFPTEKVPEHWAHGKPFPRQDKGPNDPALILNVNFFGLGESDLGRRIVADVKVLMKTTARNISFVMLDVTKTEVPEAELEMKFYPAGQAKDVVAFVSILGTDDLVAFVPVKSQQGKAAA
jgi:hypothetical protein